MPDPDPKTLDTGIKINCTGTNPPGMQPEIQIFLKNFHEFEENTAIGHAEDNLNLCVTEDKTFQFVSCSGSGPAWNRIVNGSLWSGSALDKRIRILIRTRGNTSDNNLFFLKPGRS